MADLNLTQGEADALIAMAKHRIDTAEWDYPDPGGGISVPLVSVDRREQFVLDVRQGTNRSREGDLPKPWTPSSCSGSA